MSRQVTAFVLIDGYPIDAVITEGHDFPAEISEYPVESGSEISDNIRIKPMRLTLDCVVSNTPLGVLFNQRFPTNAAPDADDPVDDIYARMLRIRTNREPVPVITSLDEFLNMALENFTVPRTGADGDEIRFTATFKQITFITNERTTVPVAAPHVAKKTNLGTRPTIPGVGALTLFTINNGSALTAGHPNDFLFTQSSVLDNSGSILTTPASQHPPSFTKPGVLDDPAWWTQVPDKPQPEPFNAGQESTDGIQNFVNNHSTPKGF